MSMLKCYLHLEKLLVNYLEKKLMILKLSKLAWLMINLGGIYMKDRAFILGFKDADGKHHTLKLNNVYKNLDESKLREAMNKLVELDMFQDKFETKLYAEAVSTKYVDTETQTVFTVED